MIGTVTFLQPLGECRDKALAGGKAVNLGVLLRAGFTVPDGFCVTTDAYRYWAGARSEEIPADLVDDVLRAYRAMGSPAVAVRSSATAEDLSEASMAGQYDTFLDIAGEDALLNRIRCCWASLDSPRTRAYLKEHGIELSKIAMAVVVQRLVPSDVAGVLFTANPQTGSKHEMLVEASWGLGESVVSGLVQPDVLRIDRHTGRVAHATIADKQVFIPPGAHEEAPVADERRRIPCLKGPDVDALWKLGLRAAEHFGAPQDIEWAIHDGKLYLLQSRPITTLAEAEAYEELLTSTRAQLRGLLDGGRGPWVVHNLAETLPHPTPLTWSVLRRFMSGDGGFGAMYRRAGFDPSPQVCRDGFLALVAGKVYMDASLAPEMFFEGFPFAYDVDELRRNPDAAQSPPTIPTGSVKARLSAARRAGAATATIHDLARDFDRQLNECHIPEFAAWVEAERKRHLAALSADELVALWHDRERRVMDEFAPLSLLPSLISGTALAELRTFLEECLWDEDVDALTHLLSSGHPPDRTLLANARLYEVARGTREVDAWLTEFGHRAPDEFDLATPRWRERPDELLQMAARLRDGADPAELHARHRAAFEGKLAEVRAKLPAADAAALDDKLALVRRYMPFREDGKYHLMLGYALLRDVALEIGRRLEIGDDVFLLTLEEMLDALNIGFAPTHLLAQRKVRRRAERRVALPYVIDASNIDDLGAPPRAAGDGSLPAFAISPGAATGPARIVRSPAEAGDLGTGYVLVCPSTDPSWTPLFTNAAGLILECGGTLSHGAVVARELSIPAVVLRDACTLLHDGDTVTLDGRNGSVTRPPHHLARREHTPGNLGTPTPNTRETTPPAAPQPDPTDTRIHRSLIPPPPGRRERAAGRLRNLGFAIWALYLLLVFTLPEWVLYQPSMAVLDALLWPLVRTWGHAGAVAAIAAGLGALTMFGQKWLTDNERLLVAKRRAAALTEQAGALPNDSPRAATLRRLAAPVQARVLGAAFVPLAVLLGPMVMTFLWFPARVDPASWNAPAGTPVKVVAMVRPDAVRRVTLDVPAGVTIDEPAAQDVPDIRRALEAWRDKERKPSDLSGLPWEVREAATEHRERTLADLAAYLRDIPPVPVSWTIQTPPNAGAWPIAVRADGAKRLDATLVTGDAKPPQPAEVANTPADPLRSLALTYQPIAQQKKVFFAPFGGRDWGWLGVYLLAYLPVMFGLRAALRIA